MKNFNGWKVLSVMALLFTSLFFTEMAAAVEAVTIGDIGRNAGDSAEGLGAGVKQWAMLLGLIFVVVGIVIFATHKKSNTPISFAIIAFIAGVLLVSIGALIDVGSATALGSSKSELSTLNIN